MKKILLFCGVVLVAIDAIVANPCANPPKIHPKACCDFPMPLPEALVASCVGQYGAQTKRVLESLLSGGPPRGACVAECLANATGLITGTDVNVEMLVGGFKMAAEGKPEWDAVCEKGVTTCASMVKSLAPAFDEAAKLPPLDPADPICSAGPGFMLFCTIKTLFMDCPAKYYKASPECDALKQYAETCPLSF
uniref:Putative plus-c odorant-binding protein 1 n=1 Tax=Lutzomyia longipalpis TaxID=7200 RepID=A0A1B0CN54_LUTLO